jgi:hypothetical protein
MVQTMTARVGPGSAKVWPGSAKDGFGPGQDGFGPGKDGFGRVLESNIANSTVYLLNYYSISPVSVSMLIAVANPYPTDNYERSQYPCSLTGDPPCQKPHSELSWPKAEFLPAASKRKVLLVIGDAAETMDILYPYFRIPEDGFQLLVVAPDQRLYPLVNHEIPPGWDITEERSSYHLQADIAFRDVDPG